MVAARNQRKRRCRTDIVTDGMALECQSGDGEAALPLAIVGGLPSYHLVSEWHVLRPVEFAHHLVRSGIREDDPQGAHTFLACHR